MPTQPIYHIYVEGWGCAFVAWLSHLILDHASLSRRSGGGKFTYEKKMSLADFVVMPFIGLRAVGRDGSRVDASLVARASGLRFMLLSVMSPSAPSSVCTGVFMALR